MLIFRLELDRAALREVTMEARARLHASGQDRTGWGNALEKADEELKVTPFVDVHVDEQGNILGLIYPPHERVGVTYYVQADRCQCEAFTSPSDPADPDSAPQKRPCRHRAKLRLVERVADRGDAHPVRTMDTERLPVTASVRSETAGHATAVPPLPEPPRIGPPQETGWRTRRSRRRAA
jgi:hypothetical protein